MRPKERGLIRVGALWTWERIRDGRIIDVQQAWNIVPTAGRNHMLDVVLHNTTPINPWYILLWEGDYTPVAGDTYATPGFTEFQSYNEANRQEYVEAAASGGITTNAASRAIFTMTSENMLYGSALVGGGTDANTKGDTAGGGTLLSSVRMGTPQVYHIAEVVRVTVSMTLVST